MKSFIQCKALTQGLIGIIETNCLQICDKLDRACLCGALLNV